MSDPLQTILDVAREIDVGLLQPRATRLRQAYAALVKAQQMQPADVDKAIREYSESCEANYVPLKKVGELRSEPAGLRAAAEPLYIKCRDGKFNRTIEIVPGEVFADFDKDAVLLGIEILTGGQQTSLIAERDRLAAENERLRGVIYADCPSVAAVAAELAAMRPVIESARRHNEAHKAVCEAANMHGTFAKSAQLHADTLHGTTAEELADALETLDNLADDKTEDAKT